VKYHKIKRTPDVVISSSTVRSNVFLSCFILLAALAFSCHIFPIRRVCMFGLSRVMASLLLIVYVVI
jgi:hypothetical protein